KTIETAALTLADKLNLRFHKVKGGLVLIAPDDEVYGLDEIGERPTYALVGFTREGIEFVRRPDSGDEMANPSPALALPAPPPGDETAKPSPNPVMNSAIHHRRDQTPGDEIANPSPKPVMKS